MTVRYAGQVAAVIVSVPYGEPTPSAGFVPHNKIDELIAAEWQRFGLSPAPLCDDATYLRRVYLDLIGTLPTPDEVTAFLGDDDSAQAQPRRRAVAASGRNTSITGRCGGAICLRVHRRYVGEKGLAAFSGWLRRSIRENRPLDRMTRELLTSQGQPVLQRPGRLLLHRQQAGRTGRDDGPGVPGRAAAVHALPPPSDGGLEPGRLLRPGRVLHPAGGEGKRR